MAGVTARVRAVLYLVAHDSMSKAMLLKWYGLRATAGSMPVEVQVAVWRFLLAGMQWIVSEGL